MTPSEVYHSRSVEFVPRLRQPTTSTFVIGLTSAQFQANTAPPRQAHGSLAALETDYRTAPLPNWREWLSAKESEQMATSDELAEAKIAAAEARAETKITRVEGKIDTAVATLIGELHGIRDDVRQADQYSRDSRFFILGAIVAGTLALGALVIGMATYGDALFGRGMNVRDVIQNTIKDYEAQRKPNAAL